MVPEAMLKDILFWSLDNGRQRKSRNNNPKDSILHYACQKGYLPVVKLLIEDRRMPHSDPGQNNEKPIHRAIECRNVEVLKYLISQGAKFDATHEIFIVRKVLFDNNTLFAKFLF